MTTESDFAISRAKASEGYSEKLYVDTVGIQTIGYGCAVGLGWSEPFAAKVLALEMQDAETAAQGIPGYMSLNAPRRSVLIEMIFNMGLPHLLGFVNFLQAIQENNYSAAAAAMLDSKWAAQVKGRAQRLATIMETGNEP